MSRRPRVSPRMNTLVPSTSLLRAGLEGDDGALPTRADARVLGATIKAGESLTHSVGEGRHAYLVAATGAIEIDGVRFDARDGAALSGGQTVAITAIDDAEIVLVDEESQSPLPHAGGAVTPAKEPPQCPRFPSSFRSERPP